MPGTRRPGQLLNKYETDEVGLPREIVGRWVEDKHARLQKYVGISRAVRKKFIGPGKAGATYIELFCGPGRVRIEDSREVLPSSPLVAWGEADKGGAPFTGVHIADAEPEFVQAAEARLQRAGAPVSSEVGTAAETVDRITQKLDPYALHFAFLDPYNLEALPFEVLRKLARFRHMDTLVHISTQDLQRNLRRYMTQSASRLDAFAPGCRARVDQTRPDKVIRKQILDHWKDLLRVEGMETAEAVERVTGGKNQPLYWLAFVARHARPLEFWEKISDAGAQRDLKF